MPWHYGRVGSPMLTSYIPTLFMPYHEKMTFYERLGNWFTAHSFNFLYDYFTHSATEKLLKRRFGNDIPKLKELVKKTSLIFVNQHFSMSLAKPLPPGVVEVGGIHIKKPKPLDKVIPRISLRSSQVSLYFSRIFKRYSILPNKELSILVGVSCNILNIYVTVAHHNFSF